MFSKKYFLTRKTVCVVQLFGITLRIMPLSGMMMANETVHGSCRFIVRGVTAIVYHAASQVTSRAKELPISAFQVGVQSCSRSQVSN